MFKNPSKTPVQKRIGLFVALSIITFGMTAAETAAQPERLSKSFAEIAKKVEPAVVSIDAKGKMPQVAARGAVPPGGGADGSESQRRCQPGPRQRRHVSDHGPAHRRRLTRTGVVRRVA